MTLDSWIVREILEKGVPNNSGVKSHDSWVVHSLADSTIAQKWGGGCAYLPSSASAVRTQLHFGKKERGRKYGKSDGHKHSTVCLGEMEVSPCPLSPSKTHLEVVEGQLVDNGGRAKVQSNPLNGSAMGPSKIWTNKRIEPLTNIFYYKSTKRGLTRSWTNNRIEPLSGDLLSGLHCSPVYSLVQKKPDLLSISQAQPGWAFSQLSNLFCSTLCDAGHGLLKRF